MNETRKNESESSESGGISVTNIAVLGGGNGGCTLAADLSLRGFSVRLFEPETFRHRIEPVFSTGTIQLSGRISGTANIHMVTDRIEEAIDDVEIIFVVVPAFAHAYYAEQLASVVESGQLVVLLPGTFGTLEFFNIWSRSGKASGAVLAEADTLPYATRIEKPGFIQVYGTTIVNIGVLPAYRTEWTANKLKNIIPFTTLNNVLEVALGSLNPVLHPPGTILNAGRIERSRGDFYIYEEGMTSSVIRVMETLDAERLSIGKALGLDLSPIHEALHASGYGPSGTTWEVLNGSACLTPIKGPTSLNTRYLTEDIPYGLVTFSSLAKSIGVATPVMDSLIHLGFALLGNLNVKLGRTVEQLGLNGLTAQEILEYVQ